MAITIQKKKKNEDMLKRNIGNVVSNERAMKPLVFFNPATIVADTGSDAAEVLIKKLTKLAAFESSLIEYIKEASFVSGLNVALKTASLDSHMQQDAVTFSDTRGKKKNKKKEPSFIYKALHPGSYPGQTLAALAIPSFIATHLLKPEHKNFL